MSYAIANIIYGIPLCSNVVQVAKDLGYDGEDAESFGFVSMYTASGPQTGYCGVCLDKFDECDAEKVSDLTWEPTDAQEAEYNRLLSEVPERLREHIDTAPTVWIIWSSS